MQDISSPPTFSLHGEYLGKPVSPKNVDLITLNQFMGEIIELLQGDLQRSELGKPKVEFSEGSVKVTVAASSLVTMSLASDVASFKKT